MATIWIHNRKSSKINEDETKKLPKLNKEQFLKLINASGNKVVTDDSMKSIMEQRRRNDKINTLKLKKLLEKDKDTLKGILKLPNDSIVREKIDINGKMLNIEMQNKSATIFELVRNHYNCQSRLNRYRIYKTLHEGILNTIDSDINLIQKFNDLTKPSRVKLLQVDEINAKIIELINFSKNLKFLKIFVPKNKPDNCKVEIGSGLRTDSCGNTSPTPSDIGLLKNVEWPLKNYNTCVRNQGGRGTCVSFGTVAAVESSIAVHYDKFVNLSEQDLYRHFKLEWQPTPSDYYGDGYSGTAAVFNAISNKYIFPYEKDWNYNPSFDRDEDDENRDYDYSCVSSGSCGTIGNCSNTNHQAKRICYQVDEKVVREVVRTVSRWVEGVAEVVDTVLGWFGIDTEPVGHWVEEQITEIITELVSIRVCVYDDSELTTDSNYYIPYGLPFLDLLNLNTLFDRDFSLNLAKLLLNLRIPIVLCFHSVPSYKNRNLNNGYAKYNGKNEKYKSGHCVLLTGFVSNDDLPVKAPKGSGGGYFIIKNSWGDDYGDCGYAYLPYDWVKQWSKTMTAVPYVGEK